jgi:hypothetical protein
LNVELHGSALQARATRWFKKLSEANEILKVAVMSDDDSFADGIRELLRNHNLSSSSFIRSVVLR